jgi:urease accessory protein UreF
MVRLQVANFVDAVQQMRQHSGVTAMRLMLKVRPCANVIVVKATDDRVTLTTALRGMEELKTLEALLGDFVTHALAAAPEIDPAEAAALEAKKNKAKKATSNAKEPAVAAAAAASGSAGKGGKQQQQPAKKKK